MFNKHNFSIIDFVANNTSNIALTGIFFTEKHCVATDSIKMIQVSNPKNDIDSYPVMPNKPKPKKNFQSFILPKEKAKEIAKFFIAGSNQGMPILDNAVVLSRSDEQVEIAKTDLESVNSVISRTIQDKYPNYKEIIKQEVKHTEISVNPHYLKTIINFYCKFLEAGSDLKIKIPKDNTKMIKFYGKRKDTEQEATALLMPIRNDNKNE